MAQALLSTNLLESLLAIGNSARVAPDDAGTQHLQILINAYQTVHLITDADSHNILASGICICHNLFQ